MTRAIHDAIIRAQQTLIMDYKPYSPEWHRYRYLKEAIDKYLDDYEENNVILADILDILGQRSEAAHQEFTRINELEHHLSQR